MNTARLLAIVGVVAFSPATLVALDQVDLRQDGRDVHVSGKVLVTAKDGGLLLLAPDGMLWSVQPDELLARREDETPFQPLNSQQLAKQLQTELAGFQVYSTTHYLICYNTSRQYAVWCGSLFERLYGAFTAFWSRKGFELHEPEFPLVAVVFSDRQSYLKYSEPELRQTAETIIGYYSLRSNRITMYDLTGIDALRAAAGRRGSVSQINQTLAQPEAEQMVATLIHEATHQIAFNCGLQTRFADIPLWVSEGIAVYFETPDLQSSKGWRTVGAVNRNRLDSFRGNLPRREKGALKALLADDKQFRDPQTGVHAYADAWALTYYLLRQRPKEYVAYLKMLSGKRQLFWDDPETRLKDFQAAFGDSLDRVELDFLRQLQKIR